MTPAQVKRYYKTTYNFRKLTGMGTSSFINWERKGYVPFDSQCKLHVLSNGDLKADLADQGKK
jgi:hypothetical protein